MRYASVFLNESDRMATLEHASIQTMTAIYGRASIKRRADELIKAFS